MTTLNLCVRHPVRNFIVQAKESEEDTKESEEKRKKKERINVNIPTGISQVNKI